MTSFWAPIFNKQKHPISGWVCNKGVDPRPHSRGQNSYYAIQDLMYTFSQKIDTLINNLHATCKILLAYVYLRLFLGPTLPIPWANLVRSLGQICLSLGPTLPIHWATAIVHLLDGFMSLRQSPPLCLIFRYFPDLVFTS
jgi:hypothetical protein